MAGTPRRAGLAITAGYGLYALALMAVWQGLGFGFMESDVRYLWGLEATAAGVGLGLASGLGLLGIAWRDRGWPSGRAS